MKIQQLSDFAVTLTFENIISLEVQQKAFALSQFIMGKGFSWVREVYPAYNSVTVFVEDAFYEQNKDLNTFFAALITDFSPQISENNQKELQIIDVDYSGEDLAWVAEYCGISVNEVIDLHTEPVYTVAMVGFLPGFPYLIGLDPKLQVPRKSTPRLRVAKGSVAIGGLQTGIYPSESPGGWQLIGKVALELFDETQTIPSLFLAGDRIKFNAL